MEYLCRSVWRGAPQEPQAGEVEGQQLQLGAHVPVVRLTLRQRPEAGGTAAIAQHARLGPGVG